MVKSKKIFGEKNETLILYKLVFCPKHFFVIKNIFVQNYSFFF